MKKVKIMLMSALVVAAVGGALAFKAQTFNTGLFCGNALNSCTVKETIEEYAIENADINNRVQGVFCSTVSAGACTYVTFE